MWSHSRYIYHKLRLSIVNFHSNSFNFYKVSTWDLPFLNAFACQHVQGLGWAEQYIIAHFQWHLYWILGVIHNIWYWRRRPPWVHYTLEAILSYDSSHISKPSQLYQFCCPSQSLWRNNSFRKKCKSLCDYKWWFTVRCFRRQQFSSRRGSNWNSILV